MNRIFFTAIILLMTEGLTVFSQGNNLKTSLSGPLAGEFNISYERMVNEKNSIQFRVGYLKPVLSPFISGKTIEPGQYTYEDSQGGIETSLEYRFYVGKSKGLKGFYLGPYFRYFNVNAQFTDEIKKDIFDVDSEINSFGLGAQLGYQWIIGDIVSVDFFFFGAGIDYHNLKLVYTIPKPGYNYSSIVDDISDVFKDVSYFYKKLNNQVNPDNETTWLPFLFPGFRIGLSLGVAF